MGEVEGNIGGSPCGRPRGAGLVLIVCPVPARSHPGQSPWTGGEIPHGAFTYWGVNFRGAAPWPIQDNGATRRPE